MFSGILEKFFLSYSITLYNISVILFNKSYLIRILIFWIERSHVALILLYDNQFLKFLFLVIFINSRYQMHKLIDK